jgi:hypothetical protein
MSMGSVVSSMALLSPLASLMAALSPLAFLAMSMAPLRLMAPLTLRRDIYIVVGMDAPSACATIMRKRDVQREPQTTKPNTTLSQ